MSLFNEAVNQTAYFKLGMLGFQGSGKTYTACAIMLALMKYIKTDKPVYFIDTETGSDWAIPMYREHGVKLLVSKTRSFKSLIDAIKEAEKDAAGLIIDSVTHFWYEIMSAYKKKKNIYGKLQFHHWGPIKEEWREFPTLIVNSKIHIAACGRAGYDYDFEEDENGKKELIKSGTKMKAEGEFGFEPSLVIEMERERIGDSIGSRVDHLGHVIKDRRMDASSIDGMTFRWSKKDHWTKPFDDIFPHIEMLNLGGDHFGVDANDNSQDLFGNDGNGHYQEKKICKGLWENIQGELSLSFPGTAKEMTIKRSAIKKYVFKTLSDTEIENMTISQLENGLNAIRDIVNHDKGANKGYDLMVEQAIKEKEESNKKDLPFE